MKKRNVILIMVAIIIGCASSVVFGIAFIRNKATNIDANFCTKNDEVYQAINTNLASWLDYFPSEYSVSISPEKEALKFSVASNKQYVVESGAWTYTKDTRVLMVALDYGIGPSIPREGIRGYVYSQNGHLPSFSQRYDSLQLANNIFCYWLKGTEPNPTSVLQKN